MIEAGVPLFSGLALGHPGDDTEMCGLSQPKIETGIMTAAPLQV